MADKLGKSFRLAIGQFRLPFREKTELALRYNGHFVNTFTLRIKHSGGEFFRDSIPYGWIQDVQDADVTKARQASEYHVGEFVPFGEVRPIKDRFGFSLL